MSSMSSVVSKSPPRPPLPSNPASPSSPSSPSSLSGPSVRSSGTPVRRPGAVRLTPRRGRLRLVRGGEAGTTTAEYTVVTAAAVAFGALLLKLLTGGWGEKILSTAFREVIKMLGF